MNDESYYDRRERLVVLLRQGPRRCIDLAAALGWDSHETRAKLISLRTEGKAAYNRKTSRWRLS